MAELVGDLLELSRLESGTLGLEAPAGLGRGAGDPGRPPPRSDRDGARHRPHDRTSRRACGPPPATAAGSSRSSPTWPATPSSSRPAGGVVELAAWFDGPVALIAMRDEGAGIGPGRPRPHLRPLLPDGRPRPDRRDRARPADRPRARPGDGWRPRTWRRCRAPARASSSPCRVRPPVDATWSARSPSSGRSPTEEIRLEERAVLRAIRGRRRRAPRPRPDADDRAADPLPLAPILPPRTMPLVVSPRERGRHRLPGPPALHRRQSEPRGSPSRAGAPADRRAAGRPDAPVPRLTSDHSGAEATVAKAPGYPRRCGRSGDSWISPLTLR